MLARSFAFAVACLVASHAHAVQQRSFVASGNGLYSLAGSAIVVRHSNFTRNGGYGIESWSYLTIADSAVDLNFAAGLFVDGASHPVVASVDRIRAHGNGAHGVHVDGASASMTVARSLIDANGAYGLQVSSGQVAVKDSVIARNASRACWPTWLPA